MYLFVLCFVFAVFFSDIGVFRILCHFVLRYMKNPLIHLKVMLIWRKKPFYIYGNLLIIQQIKFSNLTKFPSQNLQVILIWRENFNFFLPPKNPIQF